MVIFDCNKTSPKKTHTNNEAELNISAGGFFCQGNVKIRQIRCTSEMEAPPSFKGTFFGG